VTQQGFRIYNGDIVRRKDHRGKDYFWVGGKYRGFKKDKESDCFAVETGYASLTPLRLDTTDYQCLLKWKKDGCSFEWNEAIMKQSQTLVFLTILISQIGIFGCATPSPTSTGRHGFLDAKQSSRSNSRVNEDSSSSSGLITIRDSFKEKGEFRWPVRFVQVTSPFGRRGKQFHEGVDLHADPGTPVYASKTGVVLYADSKIRGYGKLVVVRHAGQVATIYAHNSRLLVHRGQRVFQGQMIAMSGSTGHTRGPHVHFEIRRGLSALNPLKVLSQGTPAFASSSVEGKRLAASAKVFQ
jgi:hypothetical protein